MSPTKETAPPFRLFFCYVLVYILKFFTSVVKLKESRQVTQLHYLYLYMMQHLFFMLTPLKINVSVLTLHS